MLAHFYCKSLYQNFNYFSPWQPSLKIKLGDIGILHGYQFERLANLVELGIPFDELMHGNTANIDFSSDKNLTIKSKTDFSTSEEVTALGQGEARIEVNFAAQKAVLLQVEGAKTRVIADQIKLAEEIERRFNEPKPDDQWKREWVVVTEVVEGDQGTILVSKDRGGQITLKAKTALNSGQLNLASASAEFETVVEKSIGAKVIGQAGITPLFKLKGISKSWWSNEGRFRTKGIGKPEEIPDITPLGIDESRAEKTTTDIAPKVNFSGEKIHVLSVGINKYKSENIPNLGECVNDTKRLQSILKPMLGIPKEQYLMLHNDQATRTGILKAFRKHFSKLKDGDTAIFYYSGHGSQEPAGQEFIDAGLEVKYGANETIVCYDSRDEGVHNIADKELRWLIHELQFPDGPDKPSKNIHFVAIFDCCHSGSILRQNSRRIRTRLDKGPYKARPIAAFLEGQYADMQQKGGIQLPPVNYISLTACSPHQLAIEIGEEGGLFTSAICELLRAGHWGMRWPTYAELLALVRDRVADDSNNRQTPHIEYSGNVNPNSCFLQVGIAGKARYPMLRKGNSKGVLEAGLGAIHGLNEIAIRGMDVPVYKMNDTMHPYSWVEIESVGVEKTRLRMKAGAATLDPDTPYQLGLFPPPMPIKVVSRASTSQENLQTVLEEPRFAKQFFKNGLAGRYELKLTERQLAIHKQQGEKRQLLYGVDGNQVASARQLLEQLEQIARWEQLNAIVSPIDSSMIARDIVWKLSYLHPSNGWRDVVLDDSMTDSNTVNQIAIPFVPHLRGIPYRISVSLSARTSGKLYFYLIYLGWNYKIEQKHENYLKPLYGGESRVLYDSSVKNSGLGFLEENLTEVLETYLLISSPKELTMPYVFEQAGLGAKYGKINALETGRQDSKTREIGLGNRLSNWLVKRLELRVQKQPRR